MSESIATWAIVELMGHVKLAGRLTEEEKFGGKLGRLDIPTTKKCTCPNAARESVEAPTVPCEMCQGSGIVQDFITQYFGGGSVYRISVVSEDVARHVSRQTARAPVSPWDFPKAALPAPKAREDTSKAREDTSLFEDDDDDFDD
ncbi:MAG TPA: hypothetical protein VFE62_20870 [Gemmataceae bacterium]|nr:hypothetical protein [Gemmataceae bacterium]